MSFDPNLYLNANPNLNHAYETRSAPGSGADWWKRNFGANVFDNPQTFATAHATHVSQQPHGDYMQNYQAEGERMMQAAQRRAQQQARAQQAAFTRAMQQQQQAMQQQQQAMMEAVMQQQQSQFSPTQQSDPEGTTYINQGEAPPEQAQAAGVQYFAPTRDRDTGATTLSEAGMFGNSLANRRTGFGSALMYV